MFAVKFSRVGCAGLVLVTAVISQSAPLARVNPARVSAGKFFLVDRSTLPAGLRNLPLRRLSSGALTLLDHNGNLVRPPFKRISSASPAVSSSVGSSSTAQVSAGVALDPRIGSNLRLGDDPTALPSEMRAQAEPHIARSPANPDFLAATFQEGRFTDGGAVDCGYSITSDGGLSWSRALIPNLTQTTGGPYYRDTDPVAGVDLSGNVYLCTEAATDPNFDTGIVLISKSTDGGQTFGSPVVVYSPPNGTVFPDKDWMAINNFPATATAGRIVVTFTRFASASSPIYRTYSDDGGVSWSSAAAVHSTATDAQGSQPIFLPNGKVVIIYWNFDDSSLDLVNSNDGGQTFGTPKLITAVREYDEPSIRSGGFLPSATTDRTNGNLYVVYQALLAGNPKIAFTKSTDGGTSWSTPMAISDNPANSGVFNPAVAVSPDGMKVTVVFYDHRNNPASETLVDLYLAQSFDGGATWQPNIRVSSVSTDASLAPLTSEGYMLGDYQGVAESSNADVPAVPVWIDTRTGNPDPFIARIGVAPQLDFTSWRSARLSLSQIDDSLVGGPTADPDSDGKPNLLEYALGTSPLAADSAGITAGLANGSFSLVYSRLTNATDITVHAYRTNDLEANSWTTSGVTETLLSDDGTIQLWQASTPAAVGPAWLRLEVTQP
jgi:BNR repeat-like domain